MTEALKPCPFCGGAAALEKSFSGGPYGCCSSCGAATMFAETDDEAIAAWNTRATPDTAVAGAGETVVVPRERLTRLAIRLTSEGGDRISRSGAYHDLASMIAAAPGQAVRKAEEFGAAVKESLTAQDVAQPATTGGAVNSPAPGLTEPVNLDQNAQEVDGE